MRSPCSVALVAAICGGLLACGTSDSSSGSADGDSGVTGGSGGVGRGGGGSGIGGAAGGSGASGLGGGGASGGGGGAPACEIPEVPTDAVNVRSYGALGNGAADDTDALQQAVDATPDGGTLVVPDGIYRVRARSSTGDWWGGVWLKSNITFVMSPGTTLQAIPFGSGLGAVLVVENVSNVVVAGGTLVGERDQHQGSDGSCMGLAVVSATDVSVRQLTTKDFYTDGIYIAQYGNEGEKLSQRIRICGSLSDRNRRQGLSITGGVDVTIEDSTFSNSGGTSPEYGIDLEPNPQRIVKDIRIQRCEFVGNRGAGIGISTDVSGCVISDNVLTGNGNGFTVIGAHHNEIRNNLIDQNNGEGIWLYHADNNTLSYNTVSANGLEHSGWHCNIRLDASSYNTVHANTCRAGSQPVKPAWGVSIGPYDSTDSTENVVTENDLRDSGEVGSLRDNGKGTVVRDNLE